ncbi:WD40-repeat-containing domain protein [Catenaria anguillulae PL171]|uniref:WD40-repeat-containing domain protein n=1 Tax=Catenaria anguillulae PL171 TaxID=765915 RepID=A0A1Y2HN61_9FUNG|nr:WD40-repeat-containing domain protein [Catenaria anguillulae PL171]
MNVVSPTASATTGPSLFRALQLRQLVGNSNASFALSSSSQVESDTDLHPIDLEAIDSSSTSTASASLPSPPRSRHPTLTGTATTPPTQPSHAYGHPRPYPHATAHVLPPIIPSVRDYSPFAHRLQVAHTLQGHGGCVNTVHWSQDADLIISGSDDQQIRIWDASTLEPVSHFHSGHSSNVFSAMFLPNTSNHEIISCAADGSVHYTRLADASLSTPAHTGRFLCHSDTTNNLALDPLGSPHVFYSCSDDGLVHRYDLRVRSACTCTGASCSRHTLLDFGLVLHGRPSRGANESGGGPRSSSRFLRRLFGGPPSDAGVASMDWVPGHPHWLGIAGNNDSVCIFDVRTCGGGAGAGGLAPEPFYVWRPSFAGSKRRAQVPHKITDMRFDPLKCGADDIEFLVSFSEEDVYVVRPEWEATARQGGGSGMLRSVGRATNKGETDGQVVGVYSGHCNERTMIKQANFFGTHHLLCGSDDGLLYVWDRATSRLLDVIPGADGHIVNCVQPHPDLPYILVSGIDDSIKLVQPTADPPTAAAHEVVDGLAPCDREQIRKVRADPDAEERVKRVARAIERNARVRSGGCFGSGRGFRTYGEDDDDDDDDEEEMGEADEDDESPQFMVQLRGEGGNAELGQPRYISLQDLLRGGSASAASEAAEGQVDVPASVLVRLLLGELMGAGAMDHDDEDENDGEQGQSEDDEE